MNLFAYVKSYLEFRVHEITMIVWKIYISRDAQQFKSMNEVSKL